MLATLVRDFYGPEDRRSLFEAIDDLCSPLTGNGFASAGVYAFFDPDSREVLYIGLARDLAWRFAQHNGLIRMSDTGCKRQQINSWFGDGHELGYAAFLQSPFEQVSVHRQAGTPMAAYYDEESGVFASYGISGLENIKITEGILLESFSQEHGRLPRWNKIGGATSGAGLASSGGYELLRMASGESDGLLVARRTMRQLSEDSHLGYVEEMLHVPRLLAVMATGGVGVTDTEILKQLEAQRLDPLYEGTDPLRVLWWVTEHGYIFEPSPAPDR